MPEKDLRADISNPELEKLFKKVNEENKDPYWNNQFMGNKEEDRENEGK